MSMFISQITKSKDNIQRQIVGEAISLKLSICPLIIREDPINHTIDNTNCFALILILKNKFNLNPLTIFLVLQSV